MIGNNCYKIVYDELVFNIPSDLLILDDINPDIYQILLKHRQYEIKTKISSYTVVRSFIAHWIKNKIPIIKPYEISDYEQLSNEFGRMKDIIQLTKKFMHDEEKFSLILMKENYERKIKKIQRKKHQTSKKYHQAIQFIFKNEYFYQNSVDVQTKKRLYSSITNERVSLVNLYKQKIIEKNGLIYSLNFSTKEATIVDCSIQILNIFIPRSLKYESTEFLVTEIQNAFSNKDPIQSIQFADDSELKIIGDYSFSNTSIESITIPKSVKKILSYSFHLCKNLKKVIFSNESKLIFIGDFAFDNCSIDTISIPNGVKSIGENCFLNCRNLKKVSFSNDSKLQCIKPLAFRLTGIETFKVPPRVFIIKHDVFTECNNLKAIEFHSNSQIYRIDGSMFISPPIENLSIPSRIVEIEQDWYSRFESLKNITILPCKKKRISLYDNKFIIGKTNLKTSCFDLLIFAVRNIEHAVIPSFIKVISPYAFYGCQKLKSVRFENDSKLETIGNYSFSNTKFNEIEIPSNVIEIGHHAFANCELEKITFSDDSKLKYINQNVFNKSHLLKIIIPSHVKIIGSNAFADCVNLTNVVFSENSEIEIIGNSCFCNTNLESIIIPNSVKRIDSYAFNSCTNLKSVTFSENSQIEQISNSIFSNSSLKSIVIPSSVEYFDNQWHQKSILENVKIHPNNNNFINYDNNFILGKSDPKSDTFDVLLFASKTIEKAIIPSFIKKIESFAFNECQSLSSVEFSEDSQLISIGESSFRCTAINSISLPSRLEKIDKKCFSKCSNLESVTFSENSELKFIGNGAFSKSSIIEFKVPSNVEYIGEKAFSKCMYIEKVDFSENSKIESFENYLFLLSPLKSLSIPSKLNELKCDWCEYTPCLTDISVSPLNKDFIFYENKFLIGKSDLDSDIYDVIYFARRDIKEAVIPSFVTKIYQNSFKNCSNLRKIEFSENSQLKIIDESAFYGDAFETICIPQHVVEIKNYAFVYSGLKYVTFSEKSELKCIKKSSFDMCSLSCFFIPQYLEKIADVFTDCDFLEIIEVDENSKLCQYDLERFKFYGIIMIPLKISKSFIL